MRIRLLGGFGVSVGLRAVEEGEWPLRKAASLVKLIALAPEHRLHRERVTELLWPQLDPKAATNNLHYAIHHARRALEPAARGARASRYLVFRDELLALCPEVPLRVDAEAFEEAADTARRTRDLAAYRAAIDLYTGELLPQDRYEAWAEDRREGLRWLYLRLLVELAELYEKREDFEPAIEALVEAVAKEPAHEEAHAGLMRLYARSGRRYEAILQYERLCNAFSEEPGFQPGEASRRLYEEIRTGKFLAASSPQKKEEKRPPRELIDDSRHNLPATHTSFIGRKRELVELKRELATSWLVTLTGAGGCGKTRLALEIVKDLAGAYPDGVWQVELVGLTEPALVPQAVAAALKVHEQPNRPLMDTLVDTLRTRQMLLVLDNCEHLLDGASRLAKTLLKSCPNLRILATSREPLSIAGEVRWRVPSLTFPKRAAAIGEAGELSSYESVRLFVDRARRQDPAFTLTGQNLRAVAEICEKLEGMPLTLELAAARVGVLSVEQIAEKLKDSIKLLTIRDRAADPRHQTLRGTLDWSYDLLIEQERKLFERLSVFAGGWTLEAAEEVGAGEGIAEEAVLDLLTRLVDKSLVVAETGERSTPRYRMLEPIRQYGREKLVESGEAEPVRRRHAAFFLALAETAEPELLGTGQGEWLRQLRIELGNLRGALSWSLEPGEERAGARLRLAAALWRFWDVQGFFEEGKGWLRTALEKDPGGSPAVRAKALSGLGWILLFQRDYGPAIAVLEEAVALYKELGDLSGTGIALGNLGHAVLHGRYRERVRAFVEEAETLMRGDLDHYPRAHLRHNMAGAAMEEGDYELAVSQLEESLALCRELGNPRVASMSLFTLGMIELVRGNLDRGAALLEEGARITRELKDRLGGVYYVWGLGKVNALRGRLVRAARLWGAAEALREHMGMSLSRFELAHSDYERDLASARSSLQEETWAAAWSEGWAMSPDEAIEYALEEEGRAPTPALEEPAASGRANPLTRRQREVALLVARGFSNRRVAEELTLSEHTAATHVRNILKKLGLDSRMRIAAWVRDRQPLL